ncbi:lactonase family protein [Furfurilactobacillus siliginis]|uniref:6-phosphogluconolactonase n=1 Tax=Furfurilactobacillus siliginis TaxID=348151 RepID=A0A0R2LBM9_9LACO|nr:lactonase family protein [Furfurilactobacillus siliginis]KRN96103.1 6-phosphogluconolactonase [Furfurilactobacillus siliginis]GEK27973.1 6-phosphogluconolactonase [Furfurilactobacillus siliginis]
MLEKFLVGTYTKKTSDGVYEMAIDTDKEQLTAPNLVARADSPTYLALSAAHKLYAVDKNAAEGIGGTTAFDLTKSPAEILNHVFSKGSSPAYVAVDEKRQLVYEGNYHTATVKSFAIQADGSLALADVITHQGAVGPAPEQTDGPHVHYTDLTPDNRLIVCDLGMDQVTIYDVSDDGKLSLVSTYQTEPGFGPRHVAFNTQKNLCYLVGELSSEIATLKYDPTTGTLTHLQTLKTIPADWTEHNGAAAIRLTADGQFVYVSNRGFNTLAVFAVQEDGTLALRQQISTEGDFPRDFALDATQQFAVVVNQNTDNATLYRRNATTGQLTLLQKNVTVPEGVCVVFE